MPKIDKSLYTKQEYRDLKNSKKLKKDQKKLKNQPVVQADKIQTTGSTAYVIGNGVSRKNIPVDRLKSFGKIYGCNAQYREYSPDYLIAVDTKMIMEISNSQYQKSNQVWTNYNRAYEKLKDFNFFKPSKGWSSGPTALWFATQHGYKTIYILGFDYKGLDGGKKFNNIYADTSNYKRSTDGATFHGNWLRQTQQVIEQNPSIQFIRVVDEFTYMPQELKNFKNLTTMQKEQFCYVHNF